VGTGMPRIPGQAGARQAKGYSPPKFAFREGESLTAAGGDRIGVVLLAAGRGTRFGDDAPLSLWPAPPAPPGSARLLRSGASPRRPCPVNA
jgi:hypothetical protein